MGFLFMLFITQPACRHCTKSFAKLSLSKSFWTLPFLSFQKENSRLSESSQAQPEVIWQSDALSNGAIFSSVEELNLSAAVFLCRNLESTMAWQRSIVTKWYVQSGIRTLRFYGGVLQRHNVEHEVGRFGAEKENSALHA